MLPYNPPTTMAKKPTAPQNFEQAIGELEAILAEMERGETPLEDSLARYERGTFLITFCRGVLGRAEEQIEQMQKGDGGGPASSSAPSPDPDADAD